MAINLSQFCLVVTIFPEDTTPNERSGTGKNGKAYTIRTQKGYFKRPSERFPERFIFPVPDGHPAYGEGTYLVDPNSFGQGDFDSLELNRFSFRLVAIPPELYPDFGIPTAAKK